MSCLWTKKWPKPCEGADLAKNKNQPKINPYNNLSFDHIDGFQLFLICCVLILSYSPLLEEGTAAEFLRSAIVLIAPEMCQLHCCELAILEVANAKLSFMQTKKARLVCQSAILSTAHTYVILCY